MAKIPLEAAWALLDDSVAVLIDGRLSEIIISPLTGNPDNEFLVLAWIDEKGAGFHAVFAEEFNSLVRVDGHTMSLQDHENDPIEIILLDYKYLEPSILIPFEPVPA
jgi:hypothetical protein